MGALVEGWSYAEAVEKYGVLDDLYSPGNYWDGTPRAAGSTEDGVDRQKMMITAIIEKGGRVNAEDVRRIWLRDFDPMACKTVASPFEGVLVDIAKTPAPAKEIGHFCDYSGLNSFSRACHPIGLINAGDINGAIDDVLEVGQLYQTTNSRGLKWACVTAVSIAEATKPDATVDSVLNAVFDSFEMRAGLDGCETDAGYTWLHIVEEIKGALEYTKDCRDFKDIREAFVPYYCGHGMPYNISHANEIVTKGVCIFKMTGGNLKDSVIAGSNVGRDTDCIAAVAAGLAGALTGTAGLPPGWVEKVDTATVSLRGTNNRRTMRECSDGLYNAFKNRLSLMRAYTEEMRAG